MDLSSAMQILYFSGAADQITEEDREIGTGEDRGGRGWREGECERKLGRTSSEIRGTRERRLMIHQWKIRPSCQPCPTLIISVNSVGRSEGEQSADHGEKNYRPRPNRQKIQLRSCTCHELFRSSRALSHHVEKIRRDINAKKLLTELI